MSGHSTIVAAEQHISADLSGEVVILNLDAGVYFGLDAVGARVWNLIQEPRTFNDIREILLDEYEVEPGRCEQELSALLRELAAAGLVEVEDETAV